MSDYNCENCGGEFPGFGLYLEPILCISCALRNQQSSALASPTVPEERLKEIEHIPHSFDCRGRMMDGTGGVLDRYCDCDALPPDYTPPPLLSLDELDVITRNTSSALTKDLIHTARTLYAERDRLQDQVIRAKSIILGSGNELVARIVNLEAAHADLLEKKILLGSENTRLRKALEAAKRKHAENCTTQQHETYFDDPDEFICNCGADAHNAALREALNPKEIEDGPRINT